MTEHEIHIIKFDKPSRDVDMAYWTEAFAVNLGSKTSPDRGLFDFALTMGQYNRNDGRLHANPSRLQDQAERIRKTPVVMRSDNKRRALMQLEAELQRLETMPMVNDGDIIVLVQKTLRGMIEIERFQVEVAGGRTVFILPAKASLARKSVKTEA